MKFEATDTFQKEFRKLPVEHRRKFRSLVPAFNEACDAYRQTPGMKWPAELRVKPMVSAKGVWEMTWSFSGPDGRATFEFIGEGDDMLVRWRHVGDHQIYSNP